MWKIFLVDSHNFTVNQKCQSFAEIEKTQTTWKIVNVTMLPSMLTGAEKPPAAWNKVQFFCRAVEK